MPYSTASMPSVDMLVLPKTEQTNGQTQPSADSDVKVSYTSAADLATLLFPTQTAIDSHVISRLQKVDTDIDDLSAH